MGESSNSLPPFLISEDIMPRVNWRYYIVEPCFDGPHDTEEEARSFALRNNIPGEIRVERLPTASEDRAKHMWRHQILDNTHDFTAATRRFKSPNSFRSIRTEGDIV
jgi:hypothetical protein